MTVTDIKSVFSVTNASDLSSPVVVLFSGMSSFSLES